MRNKKLRLAGGLLCAGLFATACGSDAAEETGGAGAAEGYLEGKSTELVVPVAPGGGFDTAARLIAPYLESCSGAEVVVVNEPGAGTLLATNNTYRGETDGSRIQIMHGVGITAAELAGAEGVQYESDKFSWIGRIDAEPHLVLTGPDGEFRTFEDMMAAEDTIRFVSAGGGSSEYVNALVLGEIFDMNVEVISGFEGGPEAWTSVLRGEADGHIRTLTSSYEEVEASGAIPLLLIGDVQERDQLIPDVPLVREFPEAEDNAALLDSHLTLLGAGRALAGPPDMEPEALEAWRAAFDCAIEDPEFLQDVEDAGRPLHLLNGGETAELYRSLTDAPEAYREILRRSYGQA
ncbi:tripartite tricarboxylate transporter substrate-binding protein [Pseudonocardia sichuanensis]